jgi:hypothetical protein
MNCTYSTTQAKIYLIIRSVMIQSSRGRDG